MRIWHYQLLPYLPDAQFKGQLRELVEIMRDWKRKGKTNHVLINKVMEYPATDLTKYFLIYREEYFKRYQKIVKEDYSCEFMQFAPTCVYWGDELFPGWHSKDYLRVCMANLYEKHQYGVGSSKITDEEWKKLTDGYFTLTGKEWKL